MLNKKSDDRRGWLSLAELGHALDISPQALHRARTKLRHQFEEGEGRQTRVYARAWLKAYFRQGLAVRVVEDPDVEPDAGNSPQLERLRRIKADREEIKLATERNEVVALKDLEQTWLVVGSHIRRATDGMCGDCRPLLESAIDDAEADIEKAFATGPEVEK